MPPLPSDKEVASIGINLLKKFHPDINHDPNAEDVFKAIDELVRASVKYNYDLATFIRELEKDPLLKKMVKDTGILEAILERNKNSTNRENREKERIRKMYEEESPDQTKKLALPPPPKSNLPAVYEKRTATEKNNAFSLPALPDKTKSNIPLVSNLPSLPAPTEESEKKNLPVPYVAPSKPAISEIKGGKKYLPAVFNPPSPLPIAEAADKKHLPDVYKPKGDLLKAIAWGKKQLEIKAGPIEREMVSYVTRSRDELKKSLGIDKKIKDLQSCEKYIKKINETRAKLLEEMGKTQLHSIKAEAFGFGTDVELNAAYRLKALNENLKIAEDRWKALKNSLDESVRTFLMEARQISDKVNNVKGMIEAFVPEIAERAANMFHLNPFDKGQLMEALRAYARALENRIIQKCLRIMGAVTNFFKGTLQTAQPGELGDTFAQPRDIYYIVRDRIMDIIFSPLIVGIFLVIALSWLVDMYAHTDEMLLLIFIVGFVISLGLGVNKMRKM